MADGNIDNLNFGVILTDTDFDRQIEVVKTKARQFNTEVSDLLDFQVKISNTEIINAEGVANAKSMAGYVNDIVQGLNAAQGKNIIVGDANALNDSLSKVLDNLDKMNQKTEKEGENVKKINTELSKTNSVMGELAKLTGITFGAVGVKNFISSLVRITGEFEVQKMALTSMLQDAGKADRIFNRIRQNALESPYTFQDLSKYAKQLTAFNIDADKLIETEKRLADVAAGLGVDMGRIILAYGQVKSAGVLKGTELRQFTEAGVPLLQSLADQIERTTGKTINLAKVFEMISKKQIPFEMVEQAFKDMTSEGGKFYNMQEVLVETLQGKIGKLRDVWQQVLYDIGQTNSGVLKDMVDRLIEFVSHLQEMGAEFNALLKGVGAYAATLAILAPLQGVAFGIQAITNIKNLIASIRAAKTMAEGYAIAMTAAKSAALAIGVAVAVFTLVAQKIKKAREEQDAYNNAVANCTRSISEENKELERLMKVAKDEKRSIDDRKGAIDSINQQYGEYLKNMGAEKVSVDNLATSYDTLREAISNKYLEELKQQTVGLKRTALNNAENELIKFNAEVIKKAGVGDIVMGGLTAAIQKIVSNRNPLIDKVGLYNLITKEYSDRNIKLNRFQEGDLYRFIDDMIEASDALKTSEKRFNDFAKGYTESMGIVTKATKEGAQATNTPNAWVPTDNKSVQKAKDNINTAIDSIKELQRAYKDYKAMGLEDDAIKKIFADDQMFGYIDRSFRERFDYWDMLLEQAEKMERYDLNDATRIRSDVMRGKADEVKKAWQDQQKEIENAQKALEKYQATYREWAGQDFNLGGTGFEYDIRKVFSDYNTKLSGVDEKYIKAVKQAEEAHKGNADAIAAEIEKLKELADAEKEYIRVQAQESLNNLAQSYLKDQYLLRGVSLDNLAGKSLGQIRRLREELLAISEDAKRSWEGNFSYIESLLGSWGMKIGELTEEDFGTLSGMLDESTVSMIKMMQAAKESGLSLETLGDKIQSALDKGLKDLDPAEKKALGNLAKYAAKQVLTLADSFGKLGDAIGDSGLSDASKAVAAIGQNLQAAAAGYQIGGGWGALAGGLVDIISQIVSAAAVAEEKQQQLQNSIHEVYRSAQSEDYNNLLNNGLDTIFGDNFVQRVRNAVNGLDEIKERLADIDKARRSAFEWQISHQLRIPGDADYISELLAQIETPDVGEMMIRTDHSFWKGDTFKQLTDIAKEFGMEINDVNGNLNPELLNAIIEKYGALNSEMMDWLKGSIAYSEDYAKAMDQIETATKDVFDNLASDMADKFIDNFMRMGNAVDDLSDTFADLGDSILRSFLQSYILDEILSNYKEQATNALKEYTTGKMTPEDYANWLEGFADNIQRESETLAPAINGMIEAFKDRGLMNIDEDTANSLGSGIKSITEDTANLLASYINAIRADVSSMRVMQESGWKDVALIAGYIASPTLNDYLAQVAANTYDNAQHTQQILMELQSVIGAPGTSGSVVRVDLLR